MDHLAGDISRQYACHSVLRSPDTPNGLGGVGVVWLLSGWWFQICLQIFTPKIGEDFQFDEYFSNGWFNHQPVVFVFFLVGKHVQEKHTVGWKKTVCPLKVDCWNRIVSFWILLGPRLFSGASYISFREGIPKMSWWKIPISPDQWINFSKLSSWAKLTQQNIRAFVGVFLFGSSNSWGVTSWGT